MSTDTHLPALNEQQRALKQRGELKAIERGWNRGVGLSVAGWMVLVLVLGAALSGGPAVILGGWVAILKAALFTSPALGLALAGVNRRARKARLVLAAGPDLDLELAHLSAEVGAFTRDTRMARLALMHAAHHDEIIRQLWDWRRSYEQLEASDAALLVERGVGLGPVGDLLGLATESTPDIGDEQLARCVAHLQYVEDLLVAVNEPRYR